MRLRLWPVDVYASEFGDRAEFFGVHTFTVPTPDGPATVQYLLYRIRGGVVLDGRRKVHMHAELAEWSFDACTEEQVDWMVDHHLEVRHALCQHLEAIADRMPPDEPGA